MKRSDIDLQDRVDSEENRSDIDLQDGVDNEQIRHQYARQGRQ